MNSRAQILKRIQQATCKNTPAHTKSERAVQPALGGDIVDVFIQKAQNNAAEVRSISAYSALPEWLAGRAEALNQSPQLVLAPEFVELGLKWPPFQLAAQVGQANSWGVCRGVIGIAETGTIVSNSHVCGSGMLFLVERLVVVIHKEDIVAYQEDAWEILRDTFNGALPRTINLITGPSRTADVEQTIQLGAHGPKWIDYLILG